MTSDKLDSTVIHIISGPLSVGPDSLRFLHDCD